MTDIRYEEGVLVGKTYKPGTAFAFRLAIPRVNADSFALLVEHDGENEANVRAMLRLADEGKAPYCVSVGVQPGWLRYPDGSERYMRMNGYDWFDSEFGDFVVHELIPHIEKVYGVRFSSSPDLHMTAGASSGGISAFVTAWFHSDFFHRVYMASPSFLAMGRGNEIPYLVRKYEPKPLKIYSEYSENEPNDYFGWIRPIDEEAHAALRFAGYDLEVKFFPGEGHSSRYRDEDEAYFRFEWLWRDWDKTPVKGKGLSPRLAAIVPGDGGWKRCDSFPEAKQEAVPETLRERYDRVVLSNDGKVWYAARASEDWIEMIVNESPCRPGAFLAHSVLHTVPRQKARGAIDMAVDRTDRLFVLTEIGVQCVRSFGLIDAILSLPDGSEPKEIAVADALYVKTDAGCYRRALCPVCVNESEPKRRQTDYYD